MSASVNKVTLIGRLGRDPEVRYTSSGQAVANFTLATDESYKDRAGEKVKKTEWINIVAWGKTVESFIQPYIHKGDMVYIEGRLQTRQWEDKQGVTKYTTEIVVDDIRGLVTSGNGDAKPAAKTTKPSTTKRAAAPATQEPEDFNGQIDDSDIPF